MIYEAWRISYQSSEQAARAAYAEYARLQAKVEAMEKQFPICRVIDIKRAHYMTKVVGLTLTLGSTSPPAHSPRRAYLWM